MEDRPRQQISFPLGGFAGGKLSGRVRLEERLRRDGDDIGLRLRPQVKYTLPLGTGRKTALVLSHESFIQGQDTDWGPARGHARMRHAIGGKPPPSTGVSVDRG